MRPPPRPTPARRTWRRPAAARTRPAASRGTRRTAYRTAPGSRGQRQQPGQRAHQRRLARPFAPISATNSPDVDGQVDPAQDGTAADGDRAVAEPDRGRHADIRSRARGRRGSRASAKGSPPGGLVAQALDGVEDRGGDAEVVGQGLRSAWAAQPLAEHGGDPLGRGSAPAAGPGRPASARPPARGRRALDVQAVLLRGSRTRRARPRPCPGRSPAAPGCTRRQRVELGAQVLGVRPEGVGVVRVEPRPARRPRRREVAIRCGSCQKCGSSSPWSWPSWSRP